MNIFTVFFIQITIYAFFYLFLYILNVFAIVNYKTFFFLLYPLDTLFFRSLSHYPCQYL